MAHAAGYGRLYEPFTSGSLWRSAGVRPPRHRCGGPGRSHPVGLLVLALSGGLISAMTRYLEPLCTRDNHL